MQIIKAQLNFLKPRKGERFQMEGLSVSGRLVLKFGKNKVTGNFGEMTKMRQQRLEDKGVGKMWERLNQPAPEKSLSAEGRGQSALEGEQLRCPCS